MVKRQKIETITAKCYKNRRRINLSNGKKKNYKNNTKDDINLQQANDKYIL